jgi:hypothetical protein
MRGDVAITGFAEISFGKLPSGMLFAGMAGCAFSDEPNYMKNFFLKNGQVIVRSSDVPVSCGRPADYASRPARPQVHGGAGGRTWGLFPA